MKQFLIFIILFSNIGFSYATESKKDGPTDAIYEPWTPPVPRKSSNIKKINIADSDLVKNPKIKTKFSKNPKKEELEFSKITRFPIRAAKVAFDHANENSKLARLLENYHENGAGRGKNGIILLEKFINENPDSPYFSSIVLELSDAYWRQGHFAKSFEFSEIGFNKIKDSKLDIRLSKIIIAEYIDKLMNFGKRDKLRAIIENRKKYDIGGIASERIKSADRALWFWENQPEQNVSCGFSAVNSVCVPLGKKPIFPDVHGEEEKKRFIANGVSLFDLMEHSHEREGDLKIIKRKHGDEIVFPSIVHWNFDHYSAILKENDGNYLIEDKSMNFFGWVSKDVVNEQSSGYFLIPENVELPANYTIVEEGEAKKIYGKHCKHEDDPEGCPSPTGGNSDGCNNALATYSFSSLRPGLLIEDTPISYKVPYGPNIQFTIQYNQRSWEIEGGGDLIPFGPRWSHSYNSYIAINSTYSNEGASASEMMDDDDFFRVKLVINGSFFVYENPTEGVYISRNASLPQLQYDAINDRFTLFFKDGQTYQFGNNGDTNTYYISKIIDPLGQSISFSYDDNQRLSTITDALNQETNIYYNAESNDPTASETNLIRRIEDPFGRKATFTYEYNSEGDACLKSITDPENNVSSFTYFTDGSRDTESVAEGDVALYSSTDIIKMTTPYGDTEFYHGKLMFTATHNVPSYYIYAKDQYGDLERLQQFDTTTSNYTYKEENAPPERFTIDGVSVDFMPRNSDLNWRNTFYWDKEQMHYFPRNLYKATVYNWLAIDNRKITGIPASIKKPLEGRVWFNYPEQTSVFGIGKISSPSKIVRAVEDEGSPDGYVWTMSQTDYYQNGQLHPYGLPTGFTDEMGREMRYVYHEETIVDGDVARLLPTNKIAKIQIKENGQYIDLFAYDDYFNDLPRKITDFTTGVVTDISYNSVGQMTQSTYSKGTNSITTKYTYDLNLDGVPDEKGYLVKVEQTDPNNPSGFITVAEYTYDGARRVRDFTDINGYKVSYDYDNLDRVTIITHPDNTFEQLDYKVLDLVAAKDRNDNWTRYFYNANRQLDYMIDPKGQTTKYTWCRCGDIRTITDANSNTTFWKRDIQGRVAKKYLDFGGENEREYRFFYEPMSGRLASATYPNDINDENVPTISYSYYLDGKLRKKDYTDAATADVEYFYHDPMGRLTAFTDNFGTTNYAYNSFASATDKGKLNTINGPFTNDTIKYAYD